MKFFDVWTTYKHFGKELGYKRDQENFYRDIRQAYIDKQQGIPSKFDYIISHQNAENVFIEGAWYACHMPYYNVWPGVFDTFIKTRLDIKAELLRFAHSCFAIRLPRTEEPILSFNFQDKPAWIESFIIFGLPEEKGYIRLTMKASYRIEGYECPGCFSKIVSMPANETIEQNFNRAGYSGSDIYGEEYTVPNSIMDACARLTVAVIFLSTGSHKVLEYDVLSKHLEVYRRETKGHKKKDYERKARDKGKFGWNIGSGRGDRRLKLPRGVSYEEACKDAGGRELLYQHVRGGHWHTVRYGKGRKDIKIVWFEDTVVRKDLPPKPLDV